MAFCTCLKSKKNVARFEVSQLQTWNLSFFPSFFLKCFSHFLNFASCNEKQYLVQATSPLFGYIAIDVYILLVIYTRRGRTGVLRGENQTPNQGTTRVECCFKHWNLPLLSLLKSFRILILYCICMFPIKVATELCNGHSWSSSALYHCACQQTWNVAKWQKKKIEHNNFFPKCNWMIYSLFLPTTSLIWGTKMVGLSLKIKWIAFVPLKIITKW